MVVLSVQLIVIADGRVAGQGTHRELLDSCPIYREMAELQGCAGVAE